MPTEEQKRVIDETSRIRVVQAVPGSGKTWLVAEIIRREFRCWGHSKGGIGALSFTNVAGEEICRAVGSELGHPHFVGTIDAFLFRYVVRPFAQLVYSQIAEPRLIPANWEPDLWRMGANGASFFIKAGTGKSSFDLSLLKTHIIREVDGKPLFGFKRPNGRKLEVADEQTAKKIHAGKRNLWCKYGFLSHADVAYLANKVLTSSYADIISGELARRFPFLVVDELQDTGWFLGNSIKELITRSNVRALLVGDPDQAIYEFNGASPELFKEFEGLPGAVTLRLGSTRRCSSPVCRIAQQLSCTGGEILTTNSGTARTFLLTYKDLRTDMRILLAHLAQGSNEVQIDTIARRHKTIRDILGINSVNLPKTGSPPTNFLLSASAAMHRGNTIGALKSVQSAMARSVFDCDYLQDEDLEELGLDPRTWKHLAVRLLVSLTPQLIEENIGTWADRAKKEFLEGLRPVLTDAGIDPGKFTFKRPNKNFRDRFRSEFVPKSLGWTCPPIVRLDTVHGVKGETHAVTVLVCPADGPQGCISSTWWSDDPDSQEERRIAFVAVTRTRGDLFICVSEKTLKRLREARPEFVRCFEVFNFEQFITQPYSLRLESFPPFGT